MQCGLCCVKHVVMLHVGVVWNGVGCGTCCTLSCGGVKWWCRGKLHCYVISDGEYGGPR